MPTYQYECKSCTHEEEIFQNMKDEPLVKCPKCKKKTFSRVVTGGLGFFMKGRTVGAIADRNTDKFSSDFKNHLNQRNKTKKVGESKIKKLPGVIQEEAPAEPTPIKKPWYKQNQTVSDRKLANATPAQLDNYVQKGKLEG